MATLPVETLSYHITDEEFALFQKLIHQETGIYLAPVKKALLVARLARRLRELRLDSFTAYYLLITRRDEEERARMLDCICTNQTHFFREPKHFEFLERHAFPQWIERAASGVRARRIRVWSAACSTGEEPYSLAMTLLWHFPPSDGWEIEILASDLSNRALEQARAAIWPLEKAEEIPAEYLKRFMLRGTRSQAGRMKAGQEIRSIVHFQRVNLNEETYPVAGLFDLILCRNVLIYFNAESRAHVISRLLNFLAPNGFFFLGHSESLNGVTENVKNVIPTVYVLPAEKRQTHDDKKNSGGISRLSLS